MNASETSVVDTDTAATAAGDEAVEVGGSTTTMSISATDAFLYGFCCLLFILVVIFLFICKITVVDVDPGDRITSTRWVKGKQRKVFGSGQETRED